MDTLTVSLVKARSGAWVITRGFAGTLPDSPPMVIASWDEAVTAIAEDMKSWADTDDDAVYEAHEHGTECDPDQYEPACILDREPPSMRATVDAILADDPPGCMGPGTAWSAWVADSIDRRVVWELTWDINQEEDPS